MTTDAAHTDWPEDLYDQIKAHGDFLSGRLGKLNRGKQLTLVGVDLTGIKLVGMNLQRAVFRGCRFYCADLRNSDFSQAVLTGCDFSGADLTNARFVWANLRGADLSRAILKGTRFENADMRPLTEPPVQPHGKGGVVSLSDTVLHNTNLSQAKLLGASFVGAILDGAILDNADLEGADFSYSTLTNVQFKNAKLRDANFQLADFNAELMKQLQGTGAKIPQEISPEVLDQVLRDHQAWIDSEGQAGRRAILAGWYLSRMHLIKANLNGADLRKANLSNANLHGAQLICADLREANLMYANLAEADLRGALVEGARGLPVVQSDGKG
ncbi:pentapeptide repeat-containing protein [uncultured Ferrovibrio sp.]|jgi:Uncharacterized low-complexity proteins|uniref:pentapeptide repeat-containing protein n=1 Tax=uncultured Ferrovibrio sp. TaxID=1576913 RepID=UPI00261E016B|nr:pentapeptide repeat-containing protein [uncultured Ferrovibrio sp.]